MNLRAVETSLSTLSTNTQKVQEYRKYWTDISPKSFQEVFRRYVFSFLSVHTSWSTNVRAYELLRQNEDRWMNNKEVLVELIRQSGCGLNKIRTEGIWKFTKEFQEDPIQFMILDGDWIGRRNEIRQACFGLGLAKSSFALEMIYPTTSNVVCLDTHMFQLYGYTVKDITKVNSNVKVYQEIERHWVTTCNDLGMEPYIGRCLFWDQKQQKESSSYWSYVFE